MKEEGALLSSSRPISLVVCDSIKVELCKSHMGYETGVVLSSNYVKVTVLSSDKKASYSENCCREALTYYLQSLSWLMVPVKQTSDPITFISKSLVNFSASFQCNKSSGKRPCIMVIWTTGTTDVKAKLSHHPSSFNCMLCIFDTFCQEYSHVKTSSVQH